VTGLKTRVTDYYTSKTGRNGETDLGFVAVSGFATTGCNTLQNPCFASALVVYLTVPLPIQVTRIGCRCAYSMIHGLETAPPAKEVL
jgi:hypothetical protein